MTNVPFLALVAPMRLATPSATTPTAKERCPRKGISNSAASRRLAHDPAEAEDHNQLLAEAYQRRQDVPADFVIAAMLGISSPWLRWNARVERHWGERIAAGLHRRFLVIEQLLCLVRPEGMTS